MTEDESDELRPRRSPSLPDARQRERGEDVVQEGSSASSGRARASSGCVPRVVYLSAVVSRLSLDHLRSVRATLL